MLTHNERKAMLRVSLGADALERVFSEAHEYGNRIFYDRVEGRYYDRHTDLYLELDDLAAFGLGI